MYKVKMDGNDPKMEKLTDAVEKKLRGKKQETIQLTVSKNMLDELKRYAGIRNQVSGKAIVLAALTKSVGSI